MKSATMTIESLTKFKSLDEIPTVLSARDALAGALRDRDALESQYYAIKSNTSKDLANRQAQRRLPELQDGVLDARERVELASLAFQAAREAAFREVQAVFIAAHRRQWPLILKALKQLRQELTPIIEIEAQASCFDCPPPAGRSYGGSKVLFDSFAEPFRARVDALLNAPRWKDEL